MNISGLVGKAKEKMPLLEKVKIPDKIKNPKNRKKVIIMGAVALLLVVALIVSLVKGGGKEEEKILTSKVSRGNVTKVIEGSGTIEAIDQYEITALVTGEILKDHFEEGSEVKKGDLLYEIDTSDIENSIEKGKAAVEKSQLSYDQSVENVTNLTVRSPITGTVQEVYIKNGDNVSNNGKVASVINSDYMRLKINFNASDASNISAGQSAEVYLDSTSAPISGEVESISTGYLINNAGAPVSMAQIVVKNPGAIKPGDMATAVVGNYACNDAGTFEYYDSVIVNAKSSGEAYNLRIRVGDRVRAGDALVYLESSSSGINARQSELSLKDSILALDNLMEQREDYNITAPINGRVIQKNSKAGDNLTNSDRSNVMAIIADLSSLVFEMSVDELDISNIEVGQIVTVTADAMENRTFRGHVENVSIVGSSSNGVTSYPVKVVMEDGVDSGLIPGMNVNASIVIDSRQDVLRVPVSAIQRGNIVYVKNGSNSAKDVKKDADEAKAPADNSKDSDEVKAPADNSKVKVTVKDGPAEENAEKAKTPSSDTPSRENRRPGNAENTDKGNGVSTTERNNKGIPTATERNNDRAAAMAERNERLLKSAQENAPKGFTAVLVSIGLSDGNFTEILSGLEEGDEIYLPDKTAANNSTNPFGGMGGGMPMGGGMRMGGGMPSTTRTGSMGSGASRR